MFNYGRMFQFDTEYKGSYNPLSTATNIFVKIPGLMRFYAPVTGDVFTGKLIFSVRPIRGPLDVSVAVNITKILEKALDPYIIPAAKEMEFHLQFKSTVAPHIINHDFFKISECLSFEQYQGLEIPNATLRLRL